MFYPHYTRLHQSQRLIFGYVCLVNFLLLVSCKDVRDVAIDHWQWNRLEAQGGAGLLHLIELGEHSRNRVQDGFLARESSTQFSVAFSKGKATSATTIGLFSSDTLYEDEGMLGETVHEAVGATHRGFVQAKGYISFNGQSEFRDPPNISDTQEIRMPPRKADVKIFTTMSVFNLIGADSPGSGMSTATELGSTIDASLQDSQSDYPISGMDVMRHQALAKTHVSEAELKSLAAAEGFDKPSALNPNELLVSLLDVLDVDQLQQTGCRWPSLEAEHQVLFGNSLPMHEFPGAGPATMMKVGTQVKVGCAENYRAIHEAPPSICDSSGQLFPSINVSSVVCYKKVTCKGMMVPTLQCRDVYLTPSHGKANLQLQCERILAQPPVSTLLTEFHEVKASSKENDISGCGKLQLDGNTSWCFKEVTATNGSLFHFVELDLGAVKRVMGVVTQGTPSDASSQGWLTDYTLSLSFDRVVWKTTTACAGNSDGEEKTWTLLSKVVKARYVRLRALAWNGKPSLRIGVLMKVVPPSLHNADAGSSSVITVAQGKQVAVNFTTSREFALRFAIYPQMKSLSGWNSILHFTKGGDDCDVHQRIPAIFFYPHSTRLRVRMEHEDACNAGCDPEEHLPEKVWSNVTLELRGGRFQVSFNGKVQCTSSSYTKMVSGIDKSVEVWAGDRHSPAAPVMLRDIVYEDAAYITHKITDKEPVPCKCENGVPASNCMQDSTEMCSECSTGFLLSRKNSCEPKPATKTVDSETANSTSSHVAHDVPNSTSPSKSNEPELGSSRKVDADYVYFRMTPTKWNGANGVKIQDIKMKRNSKLLDTSECKLSVASQVQPVDINGDNYRVNELLMLSTDDRIKKLLSMAPETVHNSCQRCRKLIECKHLRQWSQATGQE